MAETRNYSLADHTVVLENSVRTLTIGNGSSVDSISFSYENDNFGFTMSSDGTSTLNVNYMKNGTITIALNQANPFVDELIDFFNTQISDGVVRTATVTIKDSFGNVNKTFYKVLITKVPDYTAGSESGTREFSLIFGTDKNPNA